MDKILVTGGTGLVGSHLLLSLCQKGHQVMALVRSENSKRKVHQLFKAYESDHLLNNIEWISGDITDKYGLLDIFEGITHVYHAAALVSFYQKDADAMMNTNIDGTANVVNACLLSGVKKLCYVSSVAALGVSKHKGEAINELTDWTNSSETSNYSISKYYAENEVWRGAEEGLNVVIVNPAYILGYGDWNESSLQIFKRVKDGLLYHSSGRNGFVGVKDVVKIMIALMEKEVTKERFVLVSENMLFKQLFDFIAAGFNKKKPQIAIPKNLAWIAYLFDQMSSYLLRRKAILTKESVQSAYRESYFDSSKVKDQLNYEFEPIESVVKKSCELFLRYN